MTSWHHRLSLSQWWQRSWGRRKKRALIICRTVTFCVVKAYHQSLFVVHSTSLSCGDSRKKEILLCSCLLGIEGVYYWVEELSYFFFFFFLFGSGYSLCCVCLCDKDKSKVSLNIERDDGREKNGALVIWIYFCYDWGESLDPRSFIRVCWIFRINFSFAAQSSLCVFFSCVSRKSSKKCFFFVSFICLFRGFTVQD